MIQLSNLICKKNIFIILVILCIYYLYYKINYRTTAPLYNTINYYDNLQNTAELQKSFDMIAELLKIYTTYDKNGPVKLVRLGKDYDGGYVVPVTSLNESEVLLGYGIDNDISFEEQFSELYNKKSYAFDCGISSISIKNKLCKFISECIATDQFLYTNQQQLINKKISSFEQQLNNLKLHNKKLFIKIDIEGAEYMALPQILNYDVKNITGMVVEIHFIFDDHIKNTINLLRNINKNFLLIHVHGNNYSSNFFTTKKAKGKIPRVLELTYINKLLINKYKLSNNQKHPSPIDMPNNSEEPDIQFEILAK